MSKKPSSQYEAKNSASACQSGAKNSASSCQSAAKSSASSCQYGAKSSASSCQYGAKSSASSCQYGAKKSSSSYQLGADTTTDTNTNTDNKCICERDPLNIICTRCGDVTKGRVRTTCLFPGHEKTIYLYDKEKCHKCGCRELKEF